MKIVLVTGGARAGKSRWAEGEATRLAGPAVTYVATAEPHDDEMMRRIAAHRAERPSGWATIEEPLDVPQAVTRASSGVVLVDCLTLWVSNLMLAGGEWVDSSEAEARVQAAVDALLEAAGARDGTLLVVTNEVGLGIVPANEAARAYRDLLGWTNARVAAQAARVVLMVAGLPVTVR
ncbi:MAG: bifunctional adenosylcobinamide kinase/adenosylcobinamide-phosphate guanylyltransferase [Gemmatimonadota bacterium]